MADSFNVGDAYIELRLRQEKLQRDSDETVKVLNEQKAKLEGVAKSAEQAGEKSNVAFTGIAATALKAVAVMGSVELALGGINVAADLMSGNIEDAAQGLEQLPAGIGPVVRQLKDLLGTLTGIKAETESIQRVTENLEKAMAQRYETSIQGLKAEEDALMNRLKIEQQIALLNEADGEEAARLKQEFDAVNRIAAAKQKIVELDREAASFALSTGAEQTARTEQIAELEEKLADQEEKLAEAKSASSLLTNPISRLENETEALNQIEIIERELASLRELDQERTRVIQSYKAQGEEVKALIPELEKLNEAEQKALERSIEKAKTEDQKREAEERIREAEKEAAEKQRIAEKEFADRKRLAKEAFDEQIRLLREASEEAERQAQRQLEAERRIGDLRFSIRQKELGLAGQDIQAEIERINRQAEQAAKGTDSQAERDLIERERALSVQQALARAQDGGGAGGASASFGSLESAISNLQSAALSREDPSIAQRREQIQIAKNIEAGIGKVAKTLKTNPNRQQ